MMPKIPKVIFWVILKKQNCRRATLNLNVLDLDNCLKGKFSGYLSDVLCRAHFREKILFTGTKTDQYFPRYDPKSALISENGLLGFHSSLRKLLPLVTSQESKTSLFWYSHVISAPAPQCEVFFDIPTLIKVASRLRTMSKMLQVLMSLAGKSQLSNRLSFDHPTVFYTNMAKCCHWVPISR